MTTRKRIGGPEIVKTALKLLEDGHAVSLRRVAAKLGVKAPSLYSYLADKAELERALMEEGQRLLLEELCTAIGRKKKKVAFVTMAIAYVSFAKKRPELYGFMMRDFATSHKRFVSGDGLWQLFIKTVSGISGVPEDASSAAAVWSFLHGFVELERTGRFSGIGSEHAFEVGLEAFARWGAS